MRNGFYGISVNRLGFQRFVLSMTKPPAKLSSFSSLIKRLWHYEPYILLHFIQCINLMHPLRAQRVCIHFDWLSLEAFTRHCLKCIESMPPAVVGRLLAVHGLWCECKGDKDAVGRRESEIDKFNWFNSHLCMRKSTGINYEWSSQTPTRSTQPPIHSTKLMHNRVRHVCMYIFRFHFHQNPSRPLTFVWGDSFISDSFNTITVKYKWTMLKNLIQLNPHCSYISRGRGEFLGENWSWTVNCSGVYLTEMGETRTYMYVYVCIVCWSIRYSQYIFEAAKCQ